MRKTKDVKQNKGITLIALVITIIVMLILVAVTISMAVNGGLFNYAGKAAEDTKNAINKEQQLANLEANMTVDELIDKYTIPQGGAGNGGAEGGVIPEPDEEDVFESFDVGEVAGAVKAYLVANGTSAEGDTLYDMLIIGNGAMKPGNEWEENDAITYSVLSGGNLNPTYNVKIKNVIISKGVTNIPEYTFYDCTDLTSVVIPSSVTSIEKSAFDFCANLTEVVIPEGVISIETRAFGRTGLTNITIPSSVKEIGGLSFINCTNLTSVTFADGFTGKGMKFNAFNSIDGLTTLTIPVSMVQGDELTFLYSTNLSSINYKGTEEQWPGFSFLLHDGSPEVYFNGTINYNYNG